MLGRFGRVYSEFGKIAFVRIIILLIGLAGMSIIGIVAFDSFWAAVFSIVGLALGFVMRRMIVEWAKSLFWVLPAALFVYGIVLFVGERVMGLGRETQLLIMVATTVILFNIQFWSLSDRSIVNTERKTQD